MELEHEAGMPIPESRQFFPGQQIDPLPIHAYLPFICLVQRTKDMQQGTFPRTGRPDNGNDLSGSNGNIHPLQHLEGSVILFDAFCNQHEHIVLLIRIHALEGRILPSGEH